MSAATATQATAKARHLEGEPLEHAVAGILLLNHTLRPGCVVDVVAELAAIGVLVSTRDVHNTVRLLRRRGLAIVGQPRRVGYFLDEWLLPAVTWQPRPGSLAVPSGAATSVA